MAFENWDDTRRELARALTELTDRDFLILGEPTPEPRPTGLFRRRPRPVPTRYVQVLRIEDVLSAECVGAASLEGTWEMTDATIMQLRGLGWLTPAEARFAYGNVTPNFEQYVERTALPALTDVLIASLQLLDARPEALELETPHTDLAPR